MNVGKITVITGPMRSNKSLAAIVAFREAAFTKKKVIAFHPAFSSRWGSNEISSRLLTGKEGNLSIPSTPLTTLQGFMSLLAEDVDVVIFDDAQFFSNDIVNISKTLRSRGVEVWISGLDMDSFLSPFGPMPLLMSVADTVTKVFSVCHDCFEPAQTTYRLTSNGEQILVGDDEYITLCYKCWYTRKKDESVTY